MALLFPLAGTIFQLRREHTHTRTFSTRPPPRNQRQTTFYTAIDRLRRPRAKGLAALACQIKVLQMGQLVKRRGKNDVGIANWIKFARKTV